MTVVVIGLCFVAVGPERGRHGHRLIQRDTETEFRWVEQSSFRWATKTGAVLGVGIATRIGFWTWYIIPLTALASGRWSDASVTWGAYGASRAAMVFTPLARAEGPDGGDTLGRRRANATYVDRYLAPITAVGLGLLVLS